MWCGTVRCGAVRCGAVRCGVVWYCVVWCGVKWCGVVWCGVVWCGVVWCGVVWCGVVWCGVVWYFVVWCGVVLRGVVWCGVVWCSVVWCGVVWCAKGAVTRRQWPGCLPTGTGKREGCVFKCALCASVLSYSRDQCTVALGRCCSANACARSQRVYWAHCTVCAALHYQYFVCCAALLGAVHYTALCVPSCTALVGSGQWKRRNALPYCLWAIGSGSAAMHCHTAWGQ